MTNPDTTYYDSDEFQHAGEDREPDLVLEGIREKVTQELPGWRTLLNDHVGHNRKPTGRRVPPPQEGS